MISFVFFEDGKKIEISSQITPPLKQECSERFQSRSAISKLQSFTYFGPKII